MSLTARIQDKMNDTREKSRDKNGEKKKMEKYKQVKKSKRVH